DKLDLATAYGRVLLGNGDGTFAAPINSSIGPFALSAAAGDLNADGKPDLAVTTMDPYTVTDYYMNVAPGNGDGTFQPFTQLDTYDPFLETFAPSIAMADFNGDGKLDLATSAGRVLLGNGNGTFQSGSAGVNGQSVTVADFNGDGKADIAMGTD